jgi:hypothetical protein
VAVKSVVPLGKVIALLLLDGAHVRVPVTPPLCQTYDVPVLFTAVNVPAAGVVPPIAPGAGNEVTLALPLNELPPIVRGLAKAVAVVAFPLNVPVVMPAKVMSLGIEMVGSPPTPSPLLTLIVEDPVIARAAPVPDPVRAQSPFVELLANAAKSAS